MFIKIAMCLMLSSCVLRGGVSAHDSQKDTYFRGSPIIGTVSLTQDIPDSNLEIYVQHKSLLWEKRESNCSGSEINCNSGGNGLNEIGANIKFDLY